MAGREGIELARVGVWELSTGELEVTPEMLVDAAKRAQAAGKDFRAAVRLGHDDPRFDGEPALGWLHNLRTDGEGDDTVLLGDVHGMPDWLAEIEPTAYPDRSVNALVHASGDGSNGFEITGLALLGVTPPGISTIRSLRDLPTALGIEQPTPVAASFKASRDALQPAIGTSAANKLNELSASITAVPGTVSSAITASTTTNPQTPAKPPVQPPTPEGADPMSDTLIKGLRERLGIADDAELDEEALLGKLDEQIAAVTNPPAGDPPTDPPAIPEGKTVIDTDVLEELRVAASAGMEARKVQLRQERDTTIGAAIAGGHIAPARREHWAKKWDADPEGVKASIDELTKSDPIFPVAAAGYTSNVDDIDDEDALYKKFFPDEQKASV